MLLKNKGIDIILEIGGIISFDAAFALFEKKLDRENLSKLLKINQKDVLLKIANSIAMCQPDNVFVCTGSEEDKQYIRDIALNNREETKLALKGHTVHFDLKEEQGRITDRTFYIINDGEEVSSLAKKTSRYDALNDIKAKMSGIMRGKVMLIGFYLRGPLGSPMSNPAVEITSSAYVLHSAEILYRNIYLHFDKEVDRLGHFYTNIHSQGQNRPEDLPNARVYMDRSYQTTYAINCTYAGNTLLLKKGNHRFSVDKAVYKNRGDELSEHMFITGIKGPQGRLTWFAGAAPSGCGKTTTAMAGHHFMGDDLAQMWIDKNGAIRSVNPECGIFGIVENLNWEGDPLLMELLKKEGTEVIWSNVLIDEKGFPHWTGNGEEPPEQGFNFQGFWKKGMTDKNGIPVPISHSNARATLASKDIANYSSDSENPEGAITRIFTYSGRDSDTMPPVRVAKNSDHGVVIGASIVSAATSTEVGATGVNRAPWANAPFIPGPLADYMDAQFCFFGNKKIATEYKPVMAGLNYFLTDKARGGISNKLLGEKRDVRVWLTWLERKAYDEVDVIETPIGQIPKYDDLKKMFREIIKKEYLESLYIKQFSLYIDNIIVRIDLQINAYGKEKGVPYKLFEVLNEQKEGLLNLKKLFGSVVSPTDLLKLNNKGETY
ncbi:MAG: phosphoenolpyruvate carboxykinase (GTP) [Desulfobacterium sp.]|nr:phosphoenolpyruvate carboxykinase (GTP) [Desulfobacterium sp.]MBU3947941.1 phosphoenolpyruvate carboxykinase (GTP) [Pseudomonadota bacterium]MBU4037895.1 phosphoenolpyruvate carboxykinase (GTP) [Pseudomonadota bacterium]